jgi:hypothetical protein
MDINIYKSHDFKYYIDDIQLYNIMKPLIVDNNNRCLPEWVWQLNKNQSQLLLNTIMLDNKNLSNISSKKLLDDLSRLCLHAGWICIKNKIDVNIIKDKLELRINQEHCEEEWIDYNGTVHCLTVSTGIFMVRENGKPVWTGNSNRHG